MKPYIAVVGAGIADEPLQRRAETVGRLLGESGACLLTGGFGGVMEASCRGAKKAGGMTVAILPSLDRRGANPHVDVAIPTGMGEMRNALIVRAADALIAIGGEYGTLSEIAFALKLGRPVVGLGSWELARAGRRDQAIFEAGDPAEAVERALDLAARR